MKLLITSSNPTALDIDTVWISTQALCSKRSVPYIMVGSWESIQLELTSEIPYGLITNIGKRHLIIPMKDTLTKENVMSICELAPEKSAQLRHAVLQPDEVFKELVTQISQEKGWS